MSTIVNPTPAGGGGASVTQVTVTSPYSSMKLSQTVTDATVTATSKILLSLAGVANTVTTADDDIDLLGLLAVPGTGTFLLQASFLTPFGGHLTVNYLVTA